MIIDDLGTATAISRSRNQIGLRSIDVTGVVVYPWHVACWSHLLLIGFRFQLPLAEPRCWNPIDDLLHVHCVLPLAHYSSDYTSRCVAHLLLADVDSIR